MDRPKENTGGVGNTVLGMTCEELLAKDPKEVEELLIKEILKRAAELEEEAYRKYVLESGKCYGFINAIKNAKP